MTNSLHFQHDPGANEPFGVDWATHLPADTITTSTWAVAASTLTLGACSISGCSTAVMVASGTLGETYNLTNTITTGCGWTLVQTLRIHVDTA